MPEPPTPRRWTVYIHRNTGELAWSQLTQDWEPVSVVAAVDVVEDRPSLSPEALEQAESKVEALAELLNPKTGAPVPPPHLVVDALNELRSTLAKLRSIAEEGEK